MEKKYCYRYVSTNDSRGRPVVQLFKRVIIRETEKTFWHVDDMPDWDLDQLIKYRTGGSKLRAKRNVKRCLNGGLRSSYHYTREEALKAFAYRKMFQIERMSLTLETVRLCLAGLRSAGYIDGSPYHCTVNRVPSGDFVAADEPGEIAKTYVWGEY